MNQNLKMGFIYSALGKYSNLFIQLIINAILSRILTPYDYGIVAAVQVFIIFFQMLIDAGMGPAIIQNKDINESDYRVLFSFSIIFSIVLAFIFGLFGNLIAKFYDNSIFILLTWSQSIFIFFTGITVVPTAILNKKKNFKIVNFSNVIGNTIGGVFGVIFAFKGLGVYALIISSTISSIIYFCINISVVKIKPTVILSRAPLAKIGIFARNQLTFNVINYFARNADNLLIGRFMGSSALGNYSKSYQLLMMPNSILLGVINPVLQPVMSEYQDNVDYIREMYLKIVHFLALVGIPLSVFLSLSSQEIIFFLFGNQWTESVVPFTILSLSVWIQMTLSSSGTVYQSRNLTNLLLINGIVSTIILVGSILVGIFWGTLYSVSLCLLFGFIINFFVSFHMIMTKALDSNIFVLLKEFIKPIIPATLIFVALKLYAHMIPSINVFFDLSLRSIIFILIFISYVLLSEEKKFLKQLFERT